MLAKDTTTDITTETKQKFFLLKKFELTPTNLGLVGCLVT
jgi:hypothetical protein